MAFRTFVANARMMMGLYRKGRTDLYAQKGSVLGTVVTVRGKFLRYGPLPGDTEAYWDHIQRDGNWSNLAR